MLTEEHAEFMEAIAEACYKAEPKLSFRHHGPQQRQLRALAAALREQATKIRDEAHKEGQKTFGPLP